jgi:hypothetical protein
MSLTPLQISFRSQQNVFAADAQPQLDGLGTPWICVGRREPVGKRPKALRLRRRNSTSRSRQAIGRSYTELAIQMLGDLCREAAHAGANAMIDLTVGNCQYDWTLGGLGLGGTTRQLSRVAVRLR